MTNKRLNDLPEETDPAANDVYAIDGTTTRKVTRANTLKENLEAIRGLTSEADKGIHFTGSGTAATHDLTAAGRALLDDADAAAQRATLGLVIGTDVQAHGVLLDDISGLTLSQGDLLYFDGSNIQNIGAGSSGEFLKTQGAGANPVWDAVPGGGDMLSTNNLSDVANAATARKNLAGASRAITSADTIIASDIGKTLLVSSSNAFTLAVTAAATLGDGFWCDIRNTGTALITIDPNSTETIDSKTTLTLGLKEAVRVTCDGTLFYTDASNGKLVELGRVLNAAAAQVDFDFASGFPADFDEYEIHFVNVSPNTDDVYLGFRIKTTGSLTVATSGYAYDGRQQGLGGGADMSSTLDSVTDRIALTRPGSGQGIGNATGEIIDGIVKFSGPNTSVTKQVYFDGAYIRSDGVSQRMVVGGYYGSGSAWTGIRLLMSSGNIANGSIVLYGRRK